MDILFVILRHRNPFFSIPWMSLTRCLTKTTIRSAINVFHHFPQSCLLNFYVLTIILISVDGVPLNIYVGLNKYLIFGFDLS